MVITKENLNYATRNLLNRKVRSTLTILSIFVGIATIFIFISFGWGLFNYIEDLSIQLGVDKLTIQAKGIGVPGIDQTFQLLEGDLDEFKKVRGISTAGGMAFATSKVQKNKKLIYSFVIGLPKHKKEDNKIITEWFESTGIKIHTGRDLKKGDRYKVVLGHNYAQKNKLFPKALKIGEKIKLNDVNYKIVGFYSEVGNPQDDSNIYVTEKQFLTLTGKNKINYAIIVGKVDNVDKIQEIKTRAEKKIRNYRNLDEGKEDFYITTAEELIKSFNNALNIVIGFIILIALISVLVSAINTSNTMFTSILERTKEIGILKAVGAKNSEILIIFLLESGILGLIAGIIGVLTGFALSLIGGQILNTLGYAFLKPHFSWTLFVGLILFATLVGTISGMIPAYNASKKNPVDSLRYE